MMRRVISPLIPGAIVFLAISYLYQMRTIQLQQENIGILRATIIFLEGRTEPVCSIEVRSER